MIEIKQKGLQVDNKPVYNQMTIFILFFDANKYPALKFIQPKENGY